MTGDIGTGSTTVKRHGAADGDGEEVTISLDEPVSLTFALRYLTHFTKATALSNQVKLSLSPDVPLLVNYPIVIGDNDDVRTRDSSVLIAERNHLFQTTRLAISDSSLLQRSKMMHKVFHISSSIVLPL